MIVRIEPVDFELEHLVLGDGTYFVAALCHTIKCVGRSKVLTRHVQCGLGRGECEKVVAGIGRNRFEHSGILLLGLAVADRFDAPVPLLGVVAEETLLVSNKQRLATVGRGVLPVLVDAVERTLQEEAAARPTDLLADLEREVCAKLVLLQKLRCAVGLRNLVHLLIYIRGGRERNGGQLVGAEIAVVPIGRQKGVACALGRGRLLPGQCNDIPKAQHQGVGLLRRHVA